jgi:hypothetical protein
LAPYPAKPERRRPAALEPWLSEVRQWTFGPYASAMFKRSDITPEENAAVARHMSGYTGLSEAFTLRNDLRVDLSRFHKELLRDQGRTIGRLDARFT